MHDLVIAREPEGLCVAQRLPRCFGAAKVAGGTVPASGLDFADTVERLACAGKSGQVFFGRKLGNRTEHVPGQRY
jgi:hypothetical protein